MLSIVYSAGVDGIDGYAVTVECNAYRAIPEFDIVGMADLAIKEAKERIYASAQNSGFSFPGMNITINLAPADKKKEGSAFDLAMLVAILNCAGVLPNNLPLEKMCFLGELSLSGRVRPLQGVLSMADAARRGGKKILFVPVENASEASVIRELTVYGVSDVLALIAHLTEKAPISPAVFDPSVLSSALSGDLPDFQDVKGQYQAKRAMEIAAAGQHNLLMVGAPGSGKSMLAKRLPTILPPLSLEESIEVTKIHSVCGMLPANAPLIGIRPFRSPHHTISAVGLSGGGAIPKPGEISIAHNGVLFLDELPEFDKRAMEVLRQPLEDGQVTITRANGKVTFPCKFMLLAAMNPCRCGYYGHPTKKCTCSALSIRNYISRISGPLLDRIDLQIEVPSLTYEELKDGNCGDSSAVIRDRVLQARTFARKRYEQGGAHVLSNAHLTPAQLREFCVVDELGETLMKQAYERMGLSARGHDRILRVARTIADLAESDRIHAEQIAEAIQLRCLDKKYFN